MNNYRGVVTVIESHGLDVYTTAQMPSFKDATLEAGVLQKRFLCTQVYEVAVENTDDNKKTVIYRIEETNEERSRNFARNNEHYLRMREALSRKWMELTEMQKACDGYLFEGRPLPESIVNTFNHNDEQGQMFQTLL